MASSIGKTKVLGAFQGGPKEQKEYFDKWAETYDQDVIGEYGGGSQCGPLLLKHLNENDKILFIGAGTGTEAAHLARSGYKHLTALDASENMLKKAKEKEIFEKLIVEVLEPGKTCSLETNKFDAMVCIGTFYPGALDARYLEEIIRPVKKGGKTIIGVREAFYFPCPHFNYPYDLDGKMKELEEKKKWKLIDEVRMEGYTLENAVGLYRVHQILK